MIWLTESPVRILLSRLPSTAPPRKRVLGRLSEVLGADDGGERRANFQWLRDPRYAPGAAAGPSLQDGSRFLPVEIVSQVQNSDMPPPVTPMSAAGAIEIEVAGGHRMRITGSYDPEAVDFHPEVSRFFHREVSHL